LSWGLWSVIAKIGIDYLGPFRYLFYSQIVISVLVISFILGRGDYRLASTISYGKLLYPILGGVVSATAIFLLYTLLSREPGSIAIPLTSLYPIVTIFILVVVLKMESISLIKVIGAILAVVGAFLLSL